MHPHTRARVHTHTHTCEASAREKKLSGYISPTCRATPPPQPIQLNQIRHSEFSPYNVINCATFYAARWRDAGSARVFRASIWRVLHHDLSDEGQTLCACFHMETTTLQQLCKAIEKLVMCVTNADLAAVIKYLFRWPEKCNTLNWSPPYKRSTSHISSD